MIGGIARTRSRSAINRTIMEVAWATVRSSRSLRIDETLVADQAADASRDGAQTCRRADICCGDVCGAGEAEVE